VSLLQGSRASLASERHYVRVTLPAAVYLAVTGARRNPTGLLRGGVVLVGLGSTILGYAVESLRRRPLTSTDH
jgi:hypothetical protein